MPKVDLGDKQTCPACGAKFYDLRKRPAQCPKCGHTFDPDDETLRLRRAKSRIATYEPALDDEDEEAGAKVIAADDEEVEEVEATPELDAAADEAPPVLEDEDGDDVIAPAGEDLSEGFTEGDLEDVEAESDDDVPFIDDDEEFADDDLGELPDGPEDDEDPR